MLTIRAAQIRAVAEHAIGAFERRLAGEVAQDFPRARARLGRDGLFREVGALVKKAQKHGFETERQVSQYVYLAFTFGRDFDTDATLPWVGEALTAPGTPAQRMARLFAEGRRYEHVGRGLTGNGR